MRILGFAVCLLSLNCSPAFCDMAKFLCVDSENTFVVGQCSATVLPHVFLVKVKDKGTDEYRRTVDEYMCRNVHKAICSHKKVCVCVCVFLCLETCRPTPGPTEPPLEWVPMAFSLGIEQVAYEVPSDKVNNEWSSTFNCSLCLHTVLLQLFLHLLQSFRAYYIWKCMCHSSGH